MTAIEAEVRRQCERYIGGQSGRWKAGIHALGVSPGRSLPALFYLVHPQLRFAG